MSQSYSISINAGAIVLMPEDMPGQAQQDVLCSVLFAQLAASKRYPEFIDRAGWYDAYLEVLKDHWLQRGYSWSNATPEKHAHSTIAAWLLKALESHYSDLDRARVAQALSEVAQLPDDDPALKLLYEHMCSHTLVESLEGQSEPLYKVRLQLMLVSPGPSLSSVYIAFETTQRIESNPLGQVFATDQLVGILALNMFRADLSALLYGQVRDQLVEKLADHKGEKIAVLKRSAQDAGTSAQRRHDHER